MIQETQEIQDQKKLVGNHLTKKDLGLLPREKAQRLIQQGEDRHQKDEIVLQVFHHDECDNLLQYCEFKSHQEDQQFVLWEVV